VLDLVRQIPLDPLYGLKSDVAVFLQFTIAVGALVPQGMSRHVAVPIGLLQFALAVRNKSA
jgi:hypothetical protein